MGKLMEIAREHLRRREPESTDSYEINEKSPIQCESPNCGGCYDVGEGKRIHPPKITESYRKWLERWEPRGKPQ